MLTYFAGLLLWIFLTTYQSPRELGLGEEPHHLVGVLDAAGDRDGAVEDVADEQGGHGEGREDTRDVGRHVGSRGVTARSRRGHDGLVGIGEAVVL